MNNGVTTTEAFLSMSETDLNRIGYFTNIYDHSSVVKYMFDLRITLMGPKKKILHCIEATLLGKGTISSDSKQKVKINTRHISFIVNNDYTRYTQITLQQSSERSVDKGVDGGNKKLIYVETELEQMRAVCSAQREELGKQRVGTEFT